MKYFESVKDELVHITNENGGLCTPASVVEFARNEATHLHNKFEWDDSKAGHNYRLWQARQVISLELTVIKRDESEIPTQLFVSLRDDRKKGDGYRMITEVVKDSDLMDQLLSDAYHELVVFQNKYKHLKRLSKIFEQIDNLKLEFGKV